MELLISSLKKRFQHLKKQYSTFSIGEKIPYQIIVEKIRLVIKETFKKLALNWLLH